MIVEASRQLAYALEHVEYGVNVQLDALEIYPDDERPRSITKVVDWTRYDAAVRGQLGTDYPMLLIGLPDPIQMDGEVTTSIRDTSALGQRIGVALITEARAVESSKSRVESAYICRAVIKSIRTWLSNDHAGDREVNNIQMRDATNIVWTNRSVIDTEDPARAIAGAVFVDIICRDLNP